MKIKTIFLDGCYKVINFLQISSQIKYNFNKKLKVSFRTYTSSKVQLDLQTQIMPGKILKRRTMKGSFLTRYQNPFQNVKNKNKKPVLKQYNVVVERDKSLIEETEDQKGEMTTLRS